MKYEQPEMLIIELNMQVITFDSAETGDNGGFDFDDGAY